MIGVTHVSSYVPVGRESNYEKMARFGVDEGFIKNKLGVESVARRGKDEETSDLCVAAFERLVAQCPLDPSDVGCVVVCTQNPDGRGIPHTSAVVHGKLGLSEACACFDISLGCSGYVYGLSVVMGFMDANGLDTGLLFTADPYSKVVDPDDRATSMLFGDAATVTLLRRPSGSDVVWLPGTFRFATRGKDGDALNNRDAVLSMNGRAIFSFAAVDVPQQIHAVLAQRGIGTADVDVYLLHQGSKFIIDELTRRLGLEPERVPTKMAEFGNTVSSTVPLLLEEQLRTTRPDRMLLSGFGVGLSWASCLLEKNV